MAPAKKNENSQAKYPFAFFNHGLWRFHDEIQSVDMLALFSGDVAEAERRGIQSSAPSPIGAFSWTLPSILEFGSIRDEYFDTKIWKTYGPKSTARGPEAENPDPETYDDPGGPVTKRMAQAFCAELDGWLGAVHKMNPLVAVIGWIGAEAKDPWAEWSVSAALERVLPRTIELQRAIAGMRPSNPEMSIRLARLACSVIAERADTPFSDEAMETAKSALLGNIGIDPDVDYDIKFLYRRITGEALKKRG